MAESNATRLLRCLDIVDARAFSTGDVVLARVTLRNDTAVDLRGLRIFAPRVLETLAYEGATNAGGAKIGSLEVPEIAPGAEVEVQLPYRVTTSKRAGDIVNTLQVDVGTVGG